MIVFDTSGASPLYAYLAERGFWQVSTITARLRETRGIEILGWTVTIDWTQA